MYLDPYSGTAEICRSFKDLLDQRYPCFVYDRDISLGGYIKGERKVRFSVYRPKALRVRSIQSTDDDALSHELGHFVLLKPDKLLLPNFGIPDPYHNDKTYYTWGPIKNEVKAVAYGVNLLATFKELSVASSLASVVPLGDVVTGMISGKPERIVDHLVTSRGRMYVRALVNELFVEALESCTPARMLAKLDEYHEAIASL